MILSAAREVLGDVGVQGLTMDAVARRSFVARSSIYVHFAGRQALLRGLVDRCCSDLETAAMLFCDGREAPRIRVLRSVQEAAEVLDRDDRVLSTASELTAVDHGIADTLRDATTRTVRAVATRVAADQRDGLARVEVSAVAATRSLVPMVSTLRPSGWLHPYGDPPVSRIPVVARLIYRALYSSRRE